MTASKKFSDEYLNYISDLISQLDRKHISEFVDHVLGVRDNKQTIFFLGFIFLGIGVGLKLGKAETNGVMHLISGAVLLIIGALTLVNKKNE